MRGLTTFATMIAVGLLAVGTTAARAAGPVFSAGQAIPADQTPEPVSVTVLGNGSKVSDLAGPANSGYYFQLYIPPGTGRLTVAVTDGDGDADLYLAREWVPDIERHQYISNNEGSRDRILVENPQAGTWYVLLHGYSKFDDVDLEAWWGKTPLAYEEPLYVPDTVRYVTWGYGSDQVVWPIIIRPRPFLVTRLLFGHRPFSYRHYADHRYGDRGPIVIHRGPPVLHRVLPHRPTVIVAPPALRGHSFTARDGLRSRPLVPSARPQAYVFGRGSRPASRGAIPGTRSGGIVTRPSTALRTPALRSPGAFRPGSRAASPRVPTLRSPAVIRPSTSASRSRSTLPPTVRSSPSIRSTPRPSPSLRSLPGSSGFRSPGTSRPPAVRSSGGSRSTFRSGSIGPSRSAGTSRSRMGTSRYGRR